MSMSKEKKINILLVDDRPENLLAIEATIEKDEYNIVKSSSGEEALKYLLKNNVALILLDVQMPGIDGFSTAKIIKTREKTKNIPILFITANNMESEHVFMGYSLGAMDYILKPVDPMILKAKVEGFVGIHKMEQQLIEQANTLLEKTDELKRANIELSETTSKLRVSEALANVINETSLDSMFILDKYGSIIKTNPSVNKMFSYSNLELKEKNILTLFTHEESREYMENILLSVKHFDTISGFENPKEIYVTRKNGTTFMANIQIGIKSVQGTFLLACTIRDITEQKENEGLIEHMAYHDSLTELHNRRSFHLQLTKHLSQARELNTPLSVLFLDMDRFKYINDSLGHQIGDQVLLEISKRLTSSVRNGDIVSRVGGDEFNIILPNTNREGSLEIAEKIMEAIQQPVTINHYELYITTSIGLSVFPYDGEDSSVLIKNAATALYRAKENGKNNFNVFHSGMNMQSYRSFNLQNDLRKAIEQEEFEIFYQPRVNTETGSVNSAEALLRWNHPNWGIVSPGEFIPLAEETGQIIEIGNWVIKSVCNQIIDWKENRITPVRIAINLSAQQFLQHNLVESLQQIIEEKEIDPSYLEIEITESALLRNEETAAITLRKIRDMGVHISIDDFGTGYSSLHYLNRLPVNTLKIDKSFIDGVFNKTAKEQSIVTMIISLAKALNLTVIAEGVETEEQFNFIRNLHCEEIQGYLFSPPVEASRFVEIIEMGSYPLNESSVPSNIVAMPVKEEPKKQTIIKTALDQIREQFLISSRELDVFEQLLAGLSNKEISENLFISEHTVKNHISRIFQKLHVNDRAQAMAMVYQICINEGENIVR
ncbi:EAL domain-containing protein [Oceanobacillus damuensis]|uniref:EAL domain-containing protein n=1 Tax=Oceanobacillus damuensis TaxID=937928 RepID=UPI00082A5FF6|nr:EAL domain-containing protein [Oceanobacillus damuensis]